MDSCKANNQYSITQQEFAIMLLLVMDSQFYLFICIYLFAMTELSKRSTERHVTKRLGET